MTMDVAGFGGRHAWLHFIPEPLQALVIAHEMRRTTWKGISLDRVTCRIYMPRGGAYELYEADPDVPDGLADVAKSVGPRLMSRFPALFVVFVRAYSAWKNSNLRVRAVAREKLL